VRTPDYPDSDPASWVCVDEYFAGLLAPDDDLLASVLANNATAGLPAHDVSASQGQFLAVLVKLTRASRVLEIGTLGAYSTIWMARALPDDGTVITIESNLAYAEVARANIDRAGLSHKIDLREGRAGDILPDIDQTFDLIFIDADKPSNAGYLTHALRLSRPGSVIVGDNVVRGGTVIDGNSQDPSVRGVRAFLALIAQEPRLTATAVQTVGEKGWDGFAIAVVNS
jgi:predicted O-methyltransferase YrrM